MSVIGEAFVRIRPDAAGFQREAEGSVSKAGKELGKIFAVSFAVAGVAETIKSVVEAATQQQTAFAVLDRVLKNAGLSAEGFSASLKDKLEVQARATGVSAEDLAAAMDRLVPATHSSEKSIRDLNTAIGISETYHISLSTAALALAKAETGSFNSLQRYLGAIPRVTTAQDALHARYQKLVDANVKLDASQKAQYTSALAAAKAQDAVATAQNSIALATTKFGGVAQAFAQSYQGEFDRLHVSIEQLKVAIGTELVGGLASAAGRTADFVNKLLASNKVQEEVRQTAQDLGSAFHTMGAALEVVVPPLVRVTDALGGFVRVGEIAAGLFVGDKLLGGLAGVGAAGATVGASATAAAEGVTALTAALLANTAALTADAGAAARATIIYDAYGGTLATVATEETAAAAGAVELGTASSVASGKVGLLAGSIGLLKKGLLEYLIVNQAIKALPGQHDLGLDFSNSVAKDVKGAHGSPYPKGSPLDDLYQAGASGQTGSSLHFAGAGGGISVQIKNLGKQQRKAYDEGLKGESSQKANTASSFGSDALSGALAGGLTAAASDPKVTKAGNDAGKAAIKSLRDGIAADKTDLDQLKKDMAAAVTQGAEAVDQAVQSAKQNFNSIGQDLAASIYAIIDKPVTDAQTRLSDQQNKFGLYSAKLTLKNLGEAVLLPGGKSLSRDPREAIKQLTALDKRHASPALEEFIRQYEQDALGVTGARLQIRQASADKVNVRTQRRIADLTDEHNRGLITTAQFNRRLGSVLSAAGVDRGRALDVLGVAGADRFSADLQGLGLQAAASAAGPQRSGSGLVPTIVRPLETLQQTQKEIAGIAKEQRDKQLDETRKHTKLLTKIAGERAGSAFTSSLAKNPGAQTRRSKELVGVSG